MCYVFFFKQKKGFDVRRMFVGLEIYIRDRNKKQKNKKKNNKNKKKKKTKIKKTKKNTQNKTKKKSKTTKTVFFFFAVFCFFVFGWGGLVSFAFRSFFLSTFAASHEAVCLVSGGVSILKKKMRY